MSKAKDLISKISVPRKQFDIELGDGDNERVGFAQLSIGHLAEVNDRLDINLWEHILNSFSGNLEEIAEQKDGKVNPDNINREAMFNFLKELDYKLQIELIWESLKIGFEKKITKDQADTIYSYGLDDASQMEALMFSLQGVATEEEAIEEKAEEGGSKKATSTSDSEDEQLV